MLNPKRIADRIADPVDIKVMVRLERQLRKRRLWDSSRIGCGNTMVYARRGLGPKIALEIGPFGTIRRAMECNDDA
jgi:hypothetical protein